MDQFNGLTFHMTFVISMESTNMIIKSAQIAAIAKISDTQLLLSFMINEKIEHGYYEGQFKLATIKLYKNSPMTDKLLKYFNVNSIKDALGQYLTLAIEYRQDFITVLDIVENVPGRAFETQVQDIQAYHQQTAISIWSHNLRPNPNASTNPNQQFFYQNKRIY